MRYGISVYTQNSPLDKNLEYLKLAAKYGFNRLFIALHGGDMNAAEIKEKFLPLTTAAKELGYEISCDATPMWIEQLGGNVSFMRGPINLDFFKELHIDVIRLDMGMSEMEEAFLSRNEYGIAIELNASFVGDHVGNVLAIGGVADKISMCHNYYPHEYTGLSLKYFNECNQTIAKHGKKVTTFVSSQTPDPVGPWQVCDGLPTLEMHRHIPLETQVRHLLAMDCCDCIMIGNAFASEEELAAVAAIDDVVYTFHVDVADGCPDMLTQMAFNRKCGSRPDSNDTIFRSFGGRRFNPAMPKVEPFNTADIKRGDILVDNHLFGQYEGELQIALQDMKNSGRTNVIGHIRHEEHILLDYITGKDFFKLLPANQ